LRFPCVEQRFPQLSVRAGGTWFRLGGLFQQLQSIFGASLPHQESAIVHARVLWAGRMI